MCPKSHNWKNSGWSSYGSGSAIVVYLTKNIFFQFKMSQDFQFALHNMQTKGFETKQLKNVQRHFLKTQFSSDNIRKKKLKMQVPKIPKLEKLWLEFVWLRLGSSRLS